MSSIVTFNIQYDPAVIYEGDIDLNDTLVITALTDNCNIYLKRNNTPSTTSFSDRPINILYSLDEVETWLELNLESQNSSYTVNLGTLSTGDSIYIRGNNLGRSTLYGLNICTDKSASVSGNIMSLFYRKNPSNTLPQYNTYGAFQDIFSGSKITNASQLLLPTTLEDYCYAYMFENCTSLTSVPVLSATTLEEYCYQGMFKGCTSLVNAPVLASTSLAEGCYKEMFKGCSSITTAPELPVTTLKEYCYQGMFKGCTRLTTAPELPATTLVNGCYANMFENCTSLNYIHIYSDMQIGVPYTTNWVKNVAQRGTFVGSDNIEYTEIGVNGIPTTWVYQKTDYEKYFTIESLADNNTIKFNKNGSAAAKTIYWSSDKTTWNSVSSNSGTIKTLSNNEKIYIKGSNNNYASSKSAYNCFNSDYEFNISGNIMSLIYGDNFIGHNTLPSANYIFNGIFRNSKVVDASNLILPATTLAGSCYQDMFNGCTSLTTAPELPATTLTFGCYQDMFNGCTSLTTAPELPATTLAVSCYYSMFSQCDSLATAPELPATTLINGCYAMMFYGCNSLTTAPELPATTLASSCYFDMFGYCTSLTTAPELPATTLAGSCYTEMFRFCTSLTTAPELPATTLTFGCYRYMFYDCKSLVNAPELPATTLAEDCYQYMFSGCTKLNYVKCLATDISASSCLSDWLDRVAASGTFVKAASMNNWTTGNSGIPNGWTVQNV